MTRQNIKKVSFFVFIIVLLVSPIFDKSPYHLDLMIVTMMNAVLAMTFIVQLRSGLLSLAIAAFWGLGSYLSAILSIKLQMAVWICIPVAAIITGITAFLFGLAMIKNTGFSFVMLTAVIGMLFTTVVGNIDYIGGYNGIANIPRPEAINFPLLGSIDFSLKIHWYFFFLFILVAVTMVITAFNASSIGRSWMAVGMNRQLAGSLGINVFRYKMVAFVFTSTIAGMVGSIYAHYMSFIIPDTYGIWTVVYIHIYAILGGIGHVIAGPIIGSLIMTIFPELIRQNPFLGPTLVGLLLIILTMFLPRGILSLFEQYPILKTWAHKKFNAFTLRPENIEGKR